MSAATAATADMAAYPSTLVAIIESWAIDNPTTGLHCSGRLHGSVVITAKHCLGDGLVLLSGDSLCDGLHTVTSDWDAALPTLDYHDVALISSDDPGIWVGPELDVAVGERAIIWGYGLDPELGRPSCRAATYGGQIVACSDHQIDAAIACIDVPAGEQLCGGSSGSPVFLASEHHHSPFGVVSQGPPCGVEGPVRVALLPGVRMAASNEE